MCNITFREKYRRNEILFTYWQCEKIPKKEKPAMKKNKKWQQYTASIANIVIKWMLKSMYLGNKIQNNTYAHHISAEQGIECSASVECERTCKPNRDRNYTERRIKFSSVVRTLIWLPLKWSQMFGILSFSFSVCVWVKYVLIYLHQVNFDNVSVGRFVCIELNVPTLRPH